MPLTAVPRRDDKTPARRVRSGIALLPGDDGFLDSAWQHPPASSTRAGRNPEPRNRPRPLPAAAPGRSADRDRPRLAARSPIVPGSGFRRSASRPLPRSDRPCCRYWQRRCPGAPRRSRTGRRHPGRQVRPWLKSEAAAGTQTRASETDRSAPRTCRRFSGRCSRASNAIPRSTTRRTPSRPCRHRAPACWWRDRR